MKVEIYTTIRRVEGKSDYSVKLVDYFQQVEKNGFAGTLIFQSNTNDIEPWIMSQHLLSCSRSIVPFIAVNPIYMHPYTVAQKILSFSLLHNRKVNLNFISGASLSDLESMSMHLDKADRYDRLFEYVQIVMKLLTEPLPVSFNGSYYNVKNLKLSSTIDPDLLPGVFIAGSSESANKARTKLKVGSIEMGKPLKENYQNHQTTPNVLHFGVIACETNELAKNILRDELKAEYEESEEMLEISMSNSDSQWKKQLFEEKEDDIFTMLPFKNLNSDCPYLVGDHTQVANYLFEYTQKGVERFIIEVDERHMEDLGAVITLLNNMGQVDEFLI